jgi:hypothetical protein
MASEDCDDKQDSQAVTIKTPVKVFYTPAVKADVEWWWWPFWSVDKEFQQVIDDANEAYRNSKVNIELTLHSTELFDIEEGILAEDLDSFGRLTQLRRTGASVAVLIGKWEGNVAGQAATIMATAETAYAAVRHDCALGNRSFAHEIGHLQGLHHNLETNRNRDDDYSNGYIIVPGEYRSIMAYNLDGEDRINYFSNPGVIYKGHACGTAHANCARRLRETASFVKSWSGLPKGALHSVAGPSSDAKSNMTVAFDDANASVSAVLEPVGPSSNAQSNMSMAFEVGNASVNISEQCSVPLEGPTSQHLLAPQAQLQPVYESRDAAAIKLFPRQLSLCHEAKCSARGLSHEFLAVEEVAEYKAYLDAFLGDVNGKGAGKLEQAIRELSNWLKEGKVDDKDHKDHWRVKFQNLQSYVERIQMEHPAVAFFDSDGDFVTFIYHQPSGKLQKFVNGYRKCGKDDSSGIVTELRMTCSKKAGKGQGWVDVRDQYDWGGGCPGDKAAPLMDLARKACV